MDSALVSIGLPAALAVIMFGLGLSLTLDDFRRVGAQPRPVIVALVAQLLVLPLVCFGIVQLLGLSPVLAIGMMLLAASPGGTTANLFSHLFRGDVALNISLTAVNSVIAVVSLPIVVNASIAYFDDGSLDSVGLQPAKTLQVFAIVLIPVAIGMLVRRSAPAFADRADKPVRIASAVVLAGVIVGALLGERDNIGDYLADIGLATALFCVISLGLGYLLPRLAGIGEKQAVASAFEVGVHNSTLAIAVALSVLDSEKLAVPSAVYGVIMFPLALLAGLLLRGRVSESEPATPTPA